MNIGIYLQRSVPIQPKTVQFFAIFSKRTLAENAQHLPNVLKKVFCVAQVKWATGDSVYCGPGGGPGSLPFRLSTKDDFLGVVI